MKKETRKAILIFSAALAFVLGGITFLIYSSVNAPQADNVRVSLAEAKAAYDTNEALIVDVRSQGEFDKLRIPGAILIPVDNMEGNEPEVEKSALIYTYCT